MEKLHFRLIIIDDNPKIAQDVIKVLSNKKILTDGFDEIDSVLFDEEPQETEKTTATLPNFSFETATQGQEGVAKIQQAKESGKPFSLAFVDVRMPPGWDGIETIRRMWEIDPFIQVVICTAYSDYSWEDTVNELGVNANFLILKKPFDNLALRQLACGLSKKWFLEEKVRKNTEILEKTIKEKTQSLQHAFSLLRTLFDSTMEGVLVLDFQKRVVDCNLRFSEMFQLEQELISAKCGQSVLTFITKLLSKKSRTLEKIILSTEDDLSYQETLYLKNNKVFEVVSKPYLVNDELVGRFLSFHDVSEREHMSKELAHKATHDPLTNLPNRVLLRDRLDHAISASHREDTQIAILFFDLDRFKLVNDSLGHDIGDRLLCAASERIILSLRKGDTVGRMGGDEFVIILPRLNSKEDAQALSKRMIASFQKPFLINGQEIHITTSIGVSMYPENGRTVSELLRKADLAMYQAKSKRRNNCYFYDDGLNDESVEKLQLVSDLKHAIDEEQFLLYYQPQFDIDTGMIVGLEALVRWQHPKKGLIPPFKFIPEAEDSGLIVAIGEWVIEETCRQIQLWRQAGLPYIEVAVNISSWQLKSRTFDNVVRHILDKYQVPVEYLNIEITENVIVSQLEVMRMINQLRAMGLKIILDDFGTANSSLHYITEIPIDGLKIDRSYIINIAHSPNHEAIIEAIINIANNLNLKLVAEGVDNEGQVQFLKNTQCRLIQGFLYSRPIDANGIVKLFNDGTLFKS